MPLPAGLYRQGQADRRPVRCPGWPQQSHPAASTVTVHAGLGILPVLPISIFSTKRQGEESITKLFMIFFYAFPK